MVRLIAYVLSSAVLALVLVVAAETKPILAMQLLWVAAWMVGIVVTWKVARRDGRRPMARLLIALFIGPLAWVALAASTSPAKPVA